MDAFIHHNVNAVDLERLNKCRLYLQLLTLSDMVDASGRRVLQHYLDGRITRNRNRAQDRTSEYLWPTQGKPTVRDWRLWESTIRSLFVLPYSDHLQQPLRRWTSRSHQKWLWRYDASNEWIYYHSDNTYTRYAPDDNMRLDTRTSGRWYKKIDVVRHVDRTLLYICSTSRHTTNHVLLLSTSFDPPDPASKMHKLVHPKTNWDAYRSLLTYHNNDDGAALATAMQLEQTNLVGDGSYDISDDTGSAAIICETVVSQTRATNACLVPSNGETITSQHNDPYRCELVAVLLGLLFIYDMEQRHQ